MTFAVNCRPRRRIEGVGEDSRRDGNGLASDLAWPNTLPAFVVMAELEFTEIVSVMLAEVRESHC